MGGVGVGEKVEQTEGIERRPNAGLSARGRGPVFAWLIGRFNLNGKIRFKSEPKVPLKL